MRTIYSDSYCVLAPGYQQLVFNPWRAESEGRRFDSADLFEITMPAVARLTAFAAGPAAAAAPALSRCGVPLQPRPDR